MIKLTANNGEEIHEVKDIIKEVKTFYERLYSDRQLEECKLSDLVEDISTLTLQEKTSLEGKITLEEASAALESIKKTKTIKAQDLMVLRLNFVNSVGYRWVLSLLIH